MTTPGLIDTFAAAVFDDDDTIATSFAMNPATAHGAIQGVPAVLHLVEYTQDDAVATLTVQDLGTSETIIPLRAGGAEVLEAIGNGLRRQSMRRKTHEFYLARTSPVGGIGKAPTVREEM